MNQDKIGNFIYKRRKDLNMSQQDLADKLKVTDRAISNWENGRRIPDLVYIKDICNILDISLDEFFNGYKNYKFEDTNEWFLLKIKSYQDNVLEDYLSLPTIVKIDNEYKDIELIIQNKQEREHIDDKTIVTIYDDKYILTPYIKIDGEWDYIENYEGILPLFIAERTISISSVNMNTKESIEELNIPEKLSTYFDKDLVYKVYNDVIETSDKDLEDREEYYDEYDYISCYIDTIDSMINKYLKDIPNHLQELFILRCLIHTNKAEFLSKIYEYIK